MSAYSAFLAGLLVGVCFTVTMSIGFWRLWRHERDQRRRLERQVRRAIPRITESLLKPLEATFPDDGLHSVRWDKRVEPTPVPSEPVLSVVPKDTA